VRFTGHNEHGVMDHVADAGTPGVGRARGLDPDRGVPEPAPRSRHRDARSAVAIQALDLDCRAAVGLEMTGSSGCGERLPA